MSQRKRKEYDITKPVMDPAADVTRIRPQGAEYERKRAQTAAERSYKVRPGMRGFNPDSADGRRQLRAARRRMRGR